MIKNIDYFGDVNRNKDKDQAVVDLKKLNEIKSDLINDIRKKELMIKLIDEKRIELVKDMIDKNSDILTLVNYAKNDKLANIEEYLKRMFDDNLISLEKVVVCGIDTYAYDIAFKRVDVQFILQVPVSEGMTLANFDETNKGRFALYVDKDNVQDMIAMSYDFSDIKKAFQIFLKDGLIR